MTPVRLASLVLLVALGLLAVLLFRSGSDAPSNAGAHLSTSRDAAAERVEAPFAGITRDGNARADLDASASATTESDSKGSGALHVRALDHEGRPLAQARFAVYAAQAWKEQREYAMPLWKAEADAEGRASWPEAHLKLAEHAAEGGLVVRLDGFLPYVDPVTVASAEALAEEQVLHAPPFGRLLVRMLTPLEEPVPTGFAHLVAWTARAAGASGPEQRDHQRGLPILDGEARFDYVGLGIPLRLKASIVPGADVALEVAPLMHAGEERIVVARLGSDRAVLRLRVLDESGAPVVGDASIRIVLRMSNGASRNGYGSTDAKGVLWLDLPGSPELPTEVEISLSGHGNRQSGNADVKAHVVQSTGLVDLGDVILRRGPLAVSGRVLRPDGSPAVGAQIRARMTPVEQRRSPVVTPEAYLHVEEANGRFAWYESRERATPETQVLLEASLEAKDQPKLIARAQRVALGTEDVELRLEALGTIEATWREGAPWLFHDLEAHLEPEDPAASVTIQRVGSIRPSGIGFGPQLAGRYALRLRAQQALLFEIPGLVIRAGEACDDPRLRGIDLGASVTLLAYELSNPAGREGRPRGRLYARPSGESTFAWVTRDFWDRQARIALPRGRYDVAILAAGARLVRFFEVEQGQRVELEAGLPVLLALEGRAEGLADGEHLRARLERTLDGLHLQADSERFDAAGTARVLLPAPGRYRVTWRREVERGADIDSRSLDAEAGAVVVEEGPSERRLSVAAPRASAKR
jgi:hypothetical protein